MGGNFTHLLFFLNNSQTVQAKPWNFPTFSSILLETIVANLVSLTHTTKSLDIWQNSDGGISDFRISGQSLIKENCHNSRTSDDIAMKLGLVTKLYKRNKVKKIDADVMSTNCDVIVICPIYGQFEAIRKPNSARIVFKTYIFINSNLLSYKN